MSNVVYLADRRAKSPYHQFVAAGFPRSLARDMANYVRYCWAEHAERVEHAVQRVIAQRNPDPSPPEVIA